MSRQISHLFACLCVVEGYDARIPRRSEEFGARRELDRADGFDESRQGVQQSRRRRREDVDVTR